MGSGGTERGRGGLGLSRRHRNGWGEGRQLGLIQNKLYGQKLFERTAEGGSPVLTQERKYQAGGKKALIKPHCSNHYRVDPYRLDFLGGD